MKKPALPRRLVLGLCLVVMATDCKPRQKSGLLGDEERWIADNLAEFKRIEEEVAAIENLVLESGSMPLLDETVLCEEGEESTQEKPCTPKDDVKNNFPVVPQGCESDGWNNDVAWNNPVLLQLYERFSRPDEHLTIKAKAFEGFVSITAREGLFCHERLADMLITRLVDAPPADDFIYKGTFDAEAVNAGDAVCGGLRQDQRPEIWRCSTMLHCSQLRETLHRLTESMWNSDALDQMLCEARNSAAFLNYSDSVNNMIQYQYDSTIAYKKFLQTTFHKKPSRLGKWMSIPEEGEFAYLERLYKILISQYANLFSAKNNTYTAAGIRGDILAELLERDIVAVDNVKEENLTHDQLAAVTEYAKNLLAIVPSLFEYNFGVYLYLDRINPKNITTSVDRNPEAWIKQLKDRVAAGKKLFEKQQEEQLIENRTARAENRDPDLLGEVSFEEAGKILARAGVQRTSATESDDIVIPYAISPVVAFRAVANFIDFEMRMPYAGQFRDAMTFFMHEVAAMKDDWGGSIGGQIVTRLLPDIAVMQAHYSARKQQLDSASALLVQANEKYIQSLDPVLRDTYYKQRTRLQTLIEREADIAKDPAMVGFHSLFDELNRLAAALSLHSYALHAFHCTLRADDKELRGCTDKNGKPLYREGWWDSVYRSWLDPASGRNVQQITMIQHYGDLVGSWLMFQCLALRYDRSGAPPVIDEVFFVDGRKLNFDCRSYEGKQLNDYGDLRMATLRYGLNITQAEVEKLMADAIKNHPAIHTIIVVAIGPAISVLGPLTALVRIGFAAVQNAVRASLYARLATQGLKIAVDLAIQSYAFGVMEHYAGKLKNKILTDVTGLKVETSEEEEALYGSPWTNWSGVVQGAVIFGAIPLAHGAASKMVSFLMRRGSTAAALEAYAATAALPAQFARQLPMGVTMRAWGYHVVSGAAQSGAEWALFAGMPVIQTSLADFNGKMRGTYREPTKFEKVLQRMYQPSTAENMLSSLLTVAAFSANRYTGHIIRDRLLGHPPHRPARNMVESYLRESYHVDRIQHELSYFRMKVSDWTFWLTGKTARDPKVREERKATWLLGLNNKQARNAANIERAYQARLSDVGTLIRTMQRRGTGHPRVRSILNLRAQKLENARNELMEKIKPEFRERQLERLRNELEREAQQNQGQPG